MTIHEFMKLIDKWQIEEKEVLQKKANDYASDDMLSNFKKTANMTGLTPEKVFEVMLAVKMCRIIELSTGKIAKNESQEDTLMDMANYAKLYRAYLKEKNTNLICPSTFNVVT